MYYKDELASVQKIYPSGIKRFMKDGRVKGCFLKLGTSIEQIVLCEGFATACTLREYTKETVIITFTCANLKDVALSIREQYPDAEILIAADNDAHTKGNPGLAQARLVAALVNGDYIYPDFTDENFEGTDFNDYLTQGGQL